MSKLKLIAIALAVIIGTVGIVYAATTFNFQNNLVIPGAALSYFRADGSTPIAAGSDQSAIWTWDATQNRFSATIILKNTGTVATGVITVTPTPIAGWTITGTPSASTVGAGAQVSVELFAVPSVTTPGTTTGVFTVTISTA